MTTWLDKAAPRLIAMHNYWELSYTDYKKKKKGSLHVKHFKFVSGVMSTGNKNKTHFIRRFLFCFFLHLFWCSGLAIVARRQTRSSFRLLLTGNRFGNRYFWLFYFLKTETKVEGKLLASLQLVTSQYHTILFTHTLLFFFCIAKIFWIYLKSFYITAAN